MIILKLNKVLYNIPDRILIDVDTISKDRLQIVLYFYVDIS